MLFDEIKREWEKEKHTIIIQWCTIFPHICRSINLATIYGLENQIDMLFPLSLSLLGPWPPPVGSMKANFDVTIRKDFSVAAVVLSDCHGCIFAAATKHLSSVDVTLGHS